ncbi:MAG: O-antigen ligase family protein [Planctomycetota bacterium]
MNALLENPLWIVAALAAPLILLVLPWRTGWLGTIAVLAWADSSMVFGDVPRKIQVRFALLALLIVQGAIRLRGRGRGAVPALPLVAITVLAALSTWWSETPLPTMAFAASFVLFTVIGHAFVARYGASGPMARATVDRVVVVMLGLIALGFVPALRVDALLVSGRLRGFFGNPNGLGLTCALLAPFAALAFSRAKGARRVAAGGLLATLLALAFFSGSRSGFGGVVLGVATTWFLLHPSRFLLGAVAAGVLVSLASLAGGDVDLDSGPVATLARTDTVARISGRLERWEAGLARFREAPLLGHGFRSSFGYGTATSVDPDAPVEVTTSGTNYHSQHVETLVDLGAVGEALFLLVLFGAFRRARRVAGRRDEPEVAGVGAALAGAIAAATIDSFFHNWFFAVSPYAFLFWSFVGLAAGLDANRPGAVATPPRLRPLPRAMKVGVP